MATSDCHFDRLKPGETLGFFVWGAAALGGGLLAVQGQNWGWLLTLQLQENNRVPFFAAWAAFVATLWAAKIGVQNMVRQHTVNTLLQSRLSEVFMLHGEAMNVGNRAYSAAPHPKNRRDRYIATDSLVYMLNFYEYVAAGIKHGDLSEEVMADMLRSVVVGLCERYKIFIEEAQGEQETAFQNLVELAGKWRRDMAAEKWAAGTDKRRSLSQGLPAHEAYRRH